MTCFSKPSLLILLQLGVVFCLNLVSSFAKFQMFEQPAKGDGSISFLVVGDWGREGLYNQSVVAFQMGIIGEELDIDFVISTGDNFYDDGLKGVQDPAFLESFTEIYTHNSLQKPWYSVLGNHDYRDDAMAELSPVLRNIDVRWLCLRSFILNAEIAEFFFVDTTPFVDMYFSDLEDHVYDWRGINPREAYLRNLLKDLDLALRESTARWKIVVGHHAIKSVGHHGDTQELIELLLPILEDKNVDFYMNGHDHCLERISCFDSRIQFLTSGGGSKAWRGDVKSQNQCAVDFFYEGQGFMSVQLNNTDAALVFYDVLGNPMYQWNVSKQLHSVM